MICVTNLTRRLKAYDPDLFAHKDESSKVEIYRKVRSGHKDSIQHIFSLTDNWRPHGNPRHWGIEPIMEHLREIDSHVYDSFYEDMVKDRERRAEDKKRQEKNEIKALAADCRKDFAKATSDINTASMAKADKRRLKDGNSK